ncbi:3-deoxy-D-manno-octulosonic acid transferase [Roseiconus lacunae]|uniref:3-deoxy-D-manno-octulosonic acid transferase n=1 Tax=Roseiconus lacunae TaxID=2605694 RepID=A0ABT7PQX1_9BACT|nr:3-deoxy-D-manno-octulosonic acid transferase [Roseiconus lacunae]MDM4018910.1 3-deoxy-D-manno-octulosonic acid transferase [Roseiconus lacunae]
MFANFIYLTCLVIASPWIVYRMICHGRYRRGRCEKFFGLSPRRALRMRQRLKSQSTVKQVFVEQHGGELQRTPKPIWIHAVSVGEVNLIGKLVETLRRQHPHSPIVVSTSTDTGYDLACQKFGSDAVFFCPLDFSWAVDRTLRNLDPVLLVLVELELWPNLIKRTRRRGVDVAVINGRLSRRSAEGYQRLSGITRPIFAGLTRVGCQDKVTAERFVDCGTGPSRLLVTGSMKFDNAPDSRDNVDVQSRLDWAGVAAWHRVWVVGSTQDGEEAMALSIYRRLVQSFPELRLVLVPRHQERFDEVAGLIDEFNFRCRRRSHQLEQESTDVARVWTSDEVILVDTIGELRHWWGVGQLATVGGSFGDRGGQNMLEPAGYGNAVSFGPNTRNFAEIAGRLLDATAAVRCSDEADLESFVRRCLNDEPAANQLGRAAKMVVESHRGATSNTLEMLASLLPVRPNRQSNRAA